MESLPTQAPEYPESDKIMESKIETFGHPSQHTHGQRESRGQLPRHSSDSPFMKTPHHPGRSAGKAPEGSESNHAETNENPEELRKRRDELIVEINKLYKIFHDLDEASERSDFPPSEQERLSDIEDQIQAIDIDLRRVYAHLNSLNIPRQAPSAFEQP
jgi:hypothetical protein